MQTEAELRDRLTRFFNFYNPAKLSNVDRILEAYRDDYDALFQDLTLQYGPEPDEKGNLPKGTASEARSSREQSMVVDHYPMDGDGQVYPGEDGTSPHGQSRDFQQPQGNPAESNITKQVRQVSRGYYAGGYKQDSLDVARDIVYEAQVSAEMHHENEGPSSVEEVEWWKEQDRLTKGGAMRVSASGDKTMKGYRPQEGENDHATPNRSRGPRHDSSFSGTTKPQVGYSPKGWGKSHFQSPTPKKPGKAEPVAADSPIHPDLAKKLNTSPARDQSAPYDVICVRCGCLAKMTADGAIVPGSHPPHADSPPKTAQHQSQQSPPPYQQQQQPVQKNPHQQQLQLQDPHAQQSRPMPTEQQQRDRQNNHPAKQAADVPTPANGPAQYGQSDQPRPQDSSSFGTVEESQSTMDQPARTNTFHDSKPSQAPQSQAGGSTPQTTTTQQSGNSFSASNRRADERQHQTVLADDDFGRTELSSDLSHTYPTLDPAKAEHGTPNRQQQTQGGAGGDASPFQDSPSRGGTGTGGASPTPGSASGRKPIQTTDTRTNRPRGDSSASPVRQPTQRQQQPQQQQPQQQNLMADDDFGRTDAERAQRNDGAQQQYRGDSDGIDSVVL